jgi:hypothetical protein
MSHSTEPIFVDKEEWRWTGRVAQMVEYLLSKHETQTSNSSTAKKKEEKKDEDKG